ncbi:class I SAM-dependent methyltransferase [Microvirga puerhi]|uniref:Class I SAM-dependent methyltransferase n=1 Tax=Microvirga puerhi TaxID=2876078 RepID=A0ABS7VMK9_9HYPH|nr:class I SAM-dependent methyltransferase [Microvirga puerhi]MBZ6076252.1 class I SAM-dependent methyltransferase [Microvirga puerhi]
MQFDFGKNWLSYSSTVLSTKKVVQAREDFRHLLAGIELREKSFLDIGFGQGLSLLLATEAGAKVVGCDINPRCAEALAVTSKFFEGDPKSRISVVIGSILDDHTREALRQHPVAQPDGGYDIVHSWGVLHHTGRMDLAIKNAASLVRPGGHIVIAIYNRHWSSRPWLFIKWLYCSAPSWMQKFLIAALYPVIWLAKLIVTGRAPTRQTRGMDFYYNVVDWVGGYPYEYGSRDEMKRMVGTLGFECIAEIPAEVPTGCNEFVFRRTAVN